MCYLLDYASLQKNLGALQFNELNAIPAARKILSSWNLTVDESYLQVLRPLINRLDYRDEGAGVNGSHTHIQQQPTLSAHLKEFNLDKKLT